MADSFRSFKPPNFLDFLYEDIPTKDPLRALHSYKVPAQRFEHGKWQLVAVVPQHGDGQKVEVYESRMPARFYKLKALKCKNSVGQITPGFVLSTGSGDEIGELIAQMALSIAQGMLGLHNEK